MVRRTKQPSIFSIQIIIQKRRNISIKRGEGGADNEGSETETEREKEKENKKRTARETRKGERNEKDISGEEREDGGGRWGVTERAISFGGREDKERMGRDTSIDLLAVLIECSFVVLHVAVYRDIIDSGFVAVEYKVSMENYRETDRIYENIQLLINYNLLDFTSVDTNLAAARSNSNVPMSLATSHVVLASGASNGFSAGLACEAATPICAGDDLFFDGEGASSSVASTSPSIPVDCLDSGMTPGGINPSWFYLDVS